MSRPRRQVTTIPAAKSTDTSPSEEESSKEQSRAPDPPRQSRSNEHTYTTTRNTADTRGEEARPSPTTRHASPRQKATRSQSQNADPSAKKSTSSSLKRPEAQPSASAEDPSSPRPGNDRIPTQSRPRPTSRLTDDQRCKHWRKGDE